MPFISRRSFFLTLLGAAFAAPNVFALNIKGVDYMPLSELARACGMRVKTVERGRRQRVFSKYMGMDFEINSRCMSLNGASVWLGFPVTEDRGMLYVARRDYFKTISPILFPQNNGTPPNLSHIRIDAGHGGKDTGAINRRFGVSEKAVVLDISARLGKVLSQNGYKVSFSRTRDNFVELDDRPKNANAARADMFVSIHCNSADSSVSGIETFSLSPRYIPSTASAGLTRSDAADNPGNARDGWNQLLAYYVQRAAVSKTGTDDRGIKRARFAVLRTAAMPAVLVETGFLSNDSECRKLMTPAYRQLVAESIALGIMRYHNALKRLKK